MATPRLVIPMPDYERIFRVIYSVLEEHAHTPHACIFFTLIGAAILETKYKIKAHPVAGAAAIAVHAPTGTVSMFGKIVDNDLVSDPEAFHCWIQAGDVVLDFTAPLFKESLQTYGHNIPVPRRMFQKPLQEMSPSIHDLRGEGAFYLRPSPGLALDLFSSFTERHMNTYLANVCMTWFTKPPKPLPTDMGMADSDGNQYYLRPKGPQLTGAW